MSDLRVVAIVQARMGSTRLPGKVMRPIAGRPMIHHVVERTRCIAGVDDVVVATSRREREQRLVDYVLSRSEIGLFRGSEDDVLSRYYHCANTWNADVIIRITGDCPLLSPRVSGRVLDAYMANRCRVDYATNTLNRTYPRGLDTSVISLETLANAHRRASSPSQREHVTLYVWANSDRFALLGLEDDCDRHHLRWTVDTAEDLRFVRAVYDALYERNPVFEYEDVVRLLDKRPHLCRINEGVRQKPIGT